MQNLTSPYKVGFCLMPIVSLIISSLRLYNEKLRGCSTQVEVGVKNYSYFLFQESEIATTLSVL